MDENQAEKTITIRVSTGTILKIIGFILLLVFLYYVLDIIVVILVATLIATALNPLVNWFQSKKIPRPLGVIIIYICIAVLFFGIIALLIPPVTSEIQQIAANFPALWERFTASLAENRNLELEKQITESVNKGLGSLQEVLRSSATDIFSFIKNIFGNVVSFILIFVLTFYFLVQEDAIKKAFRNFTPQKYQPYLNDLITRMQERVAQWLRGEIILIFVVGLLTLVGLKILGIKYFLVLALFAGVLEVVPYIGPVIAAIPAAFIALSESFWKGVAVIILFWLIQQMENHVIVPKVMQKVVGLNPIIIIIVILIGARLLGFVGILIAVPLSAALSVLAKDIFAWKEIGKETHEGSGESG